MVGSGISAEYMAEELRQRLSSGEDPRRIEFELKRFVSVYGYSQEFEEIEMMIMKEKSS